jgi:S-DNA-T family DNA segregation ATPase FtsK/SpoIIIE
MTTDTPESADVPTATGRDRRRRAGAPRGATTPDAPAETAPAGDFARQLRAQARAVGDRLKDSLDGQVTGRVVRGVGQLIRRFGTPNPPATKPAPDATADRGGSTLPATGRERSPVQTASDPEPVDETALLARFHQRRQERENRRALQGERRRLPLPPASEPPTEDPDEPTPAGAACPPKAAPATLPTAPPPAPPDPAPNDLTATLYRLPSLELLACADTVTVADPDEIAHNRRTIQDTLDSFSIDAEVGRATRGPRVTLYEVSVSRGVKVEAISHIANNLAMELAAVSLRILAPVPGQDYVGIEVPNRDPDTVRLGSLLRGELWTRTRADIPLMMGRNIHGAEVILDLAKAPHLLVAGATGSGKSVCLNAILLSLLYRFGPEDLRLVLVDPKVVEFSVYNRLPHLVVPVITDVSTVVMALRWLIQEMTHRYRLFGRVGARHLQGFNSRPPDAPHVADNDGMPVPRHLPHIVLVIDELADIMLTARQDVETSLARIAQMSRAVGIHTVIATQRPSVNIITGIIKANFPTRVAFQVSSQVDARTILDSKGAESLLGRGDMLFKPPGTARVQRLQAPMVEDAEIEAVATFASAQGAARTDFGVLKLAADDSGAVESGSPGEAAADEALVRQAMEIVLRDRRASTSYLQRRLRIGYNRAASIMDCLEQRGVIGPSLGAGPREILADTPQGENDRDG